MVQEAVDNLLADILHAALLQAVLKGFVLNAGEDVHMVYLLQHRVSGFGGHLAAVVAIDLIAVVLGRVVTGRYHYAGLAVELPHRKGEHGGGHQLGIQVDMYPVGRQHRRRFPREQVGLDAAIIGDGNLGLLVFFVDIIRQALGGAPDGIYVHPVHTGSNHSAEPCGAEFQFPVEAVVDFLRGILDILQFLCQVRVLQLH